MTNYTFRKANESDFEFLYNLNKTTMREHVVQVWGKWDENWQREYFKKDFDPKENKIIVVDDEDAGCLSVTEDKSNIQLERLHLLPKFQGLGIGTKVLDKLIEESNKNSKIFSLTVLRSNERAKMLYERKGFVITKETKERYYMTFR